MAITYPLTLPSSVKITTADFGFNYNNLAHQSPDTGASQIVGRAGNLLSGRWVFAPVNGDAGRDLQVFLASLNGQEGTFRAYNTEYRTPRGVATGTPLVKGAGQAGNTLLTDGWTADTLQILRDGDWFGVDNQLKLEVEDADTDVTGEALLSFRMNLHRPPPDNAPITVTNPTGIFMLDDDTAGRWSSDPNEVIRTGIGFVEVPQV